MIGKDGHSETERVLVSYDGLISLSLLKIQSFPTGNFWGDHNNILCVTDERVKHTVIGKK